MFPLGTIYFMCPLLLIWQNLFITIFVMYGYTYLFHLYKLIVINLLLINSNYFLMKLDNIINNKI